MHFKTPQEIIDAYSNGFKGSFCDPEKLAEFLSGLKNPLFGGAAPSLAGSGKGKKSLCYLALMEFDPNFGNDEPQTTGDCVSKGSRTAVDNTRAFEIKSGESEDFVARGATEILYKSRGYGSEGMSCDAAARWFTTTGGILLRKNYPELGLDLSKYDARIGMQGNRPIDAKILAEAKKHQVKSTTLIRTVEEARDALANGYCIAVCSNYGFSSTRDKNGIAARKGSWNHCYLENTVIFSEESKYIQDIICGDSVYSHDGTLNKVTNTFVRNYNGKILKIKPYGLPEFSITEEHPLFVMRNNIFIWIKANKLEKEDLLITPKYQSSSKIEIPKWNYISNHTQNIPKKLEINDDLAWLFGLYIADGHCVENHKIVITIDNKWKSIIEKAKSIIENNLNLECFIYDKKTYSRITVYSKVLANNFKDWFGIDVYNKKIPSFILHGWNLDSLCNGILDGDGGNYKKKNYINGVNKTLLYSIWFYLLNNGKLPILNKTKTTKKSFKNAKQGYKIEYILNRKINRFFYEKDNLYFRKIKYIKEESFNGKVYNFEVENTNSYIADGVSTHNCMAWLGCDDSHDVVKETIFLVQNSWGDWISGPKLYDQPEGSFWVREEDAAQMLRQNGAFIYSSVDGFPPRKIKSRLSEVFG